MTREAIARKIRWPVIIWLAGIVNVGAMLPQLTEIIRTGNVEGLSLGMFGIYLGIQIAFAIEGYFTRNRMLMVCLGLSAVVSTVIISLVLYIRKFGWSPEHTQAVLGAVKNGAGMITCVLMIGKNAWYLPLIIRRRVKPAPATWITASFAMVLAAVSYSAIPGRTVIENITLYAAAFEILFVLATIIVVGWRAGDFAVTFDGLQKACLMVMVGVIGYWASHQDQPGVTFWTMQCLLVVAYVATIMRAIQKRTAFDSIGNWGTLCLASIVGSLPAVMMASPYGITNSVRAVASSGLTVCVLIYYDRKAESARWKDEKSTVAAFYRIRT